MERFVMLEYTPSCSHPRRAQVLAEFACGLLQAETCLHVEGRQKYRSNWQNYSITTGQAPNKPKRQTPPLRQGRDPAPAVEARALCGKQNPVFTWSFYSHWTEMQILRCYSDSRNRSGRPGLIMNGQYTHIVQMQFGKYHDCIPTISEAHRIEPIRSGPSSWEISLTSRLPQSPIHHRSRRW